MQITPEAADLDAIFDAQQSEPLRDQWGRPLLVPGETRREESLIPVRKVRDDGKIPYTRASSFSNYINDHSAVDIWEKRSIVYGMGQREDLAARAAALPPIISNTRDKSTLTRQEKALDQITNKALDEIGSEAAKYANRDYKADWGTAVHGFTDPGPSGDVPARMKADVDSWFDKTRGWEFFLTEAFVRNDTFQVAGTFDHAVKIPWRPDLGLIIVDKKTGILHLDQFAVQGCCYATGELYDPRTDSTYEWPEPVNQEWAILAHIPLGTGRTDLYLVNLLEGYVDCTVARDVRARRQRKDHGELMDLDQDRLNHIAFCIANADSRETMYAIASDFGPWWSESFRIMARQRLAELGL